MPKPAAKPNRNPVRVDYDLPLLFKKPKGAHSFKVWPVQRTPYEKRFGGKGLWFRCFVFPTKEAFIAVDNSLRDLSGVDHSDTQDPPSAAVIGFNNCLLEDSETGELLTDGCIGYIFFVHERVDAEIACHESVHAAMHYWRRIKRRRSLLVDHENAEEQIAYSTGVIAAQIQRGISKIYQRLEAAR